MNEVTRMAAPVFLGGLALLGSLAGVLICNPSAVAAVPPLAGRGACVLEMAGFDSERANGGCRLSVDEISVHRKPVLGVFGILGLNEEVVRGITVDAAPGVSPLQALRDVPAGVSSLADLHFEKLGLTFWVRTSHFRLRAETAALTPNDVTFKEISLLRLPVGSPATLPWATWNEATHRWVLPPQAGAGWSGLQ